MQHTKSGEAHTLIGQGSVKATESVPLSEVAQPSISMDIRSTFLASGCAVGRGAVAGFARFVACADDLDAFRPGEILLADLTTPLCEPAAAMAAAIVTNWGGTKSHAASMARKYGVPAVVGTVDGASRLWTGAYLTVSCPEGESGRVYECAFPSAPIRPL
jgi:pyruvate,water dikinase